jgi:hypothetical protein
LVKGQAALPEIELVILPAVGEALGAVTVVRERRFLITVAAAAVLQHLEVELRVPVEQTVGPVGLVAEQLGVEEAETVETQAVLLQMAAGAEVVRLVVVVGLVVVGGPYRVLVLGLDTKIITPLFPEILTP